MAGEAPPLPDRLRTAALRVHGRRLRRRAARGRSGLGEDREGRGREGARDMMRGVRPALLRLPGGVGYRLAGALHIRKPMIMPSATNPTKEMVMASVNNGTEPAPIPEAGTAPADRPTHRKGSQGGPLEVQMEGRSKRLRVRAAGDIWSDD